MPKLFEAPTLRRYGSVGNITASDFKCTPGGDGGFAGERYRNDATDAYVYSETADAWVNINDVLGPNCRSGVGHTNEPNTPQNPANGGPIP